MILAIMSVETFVYTVLRNLRMSSTGMMTPHASVSGLMFAHPKSQYFELGRIGDDQLHDYARRRGLPVELIRKFLKTV